MKCFKCSQMTTTKNHTNNGQMCVVVVVYDIQKLAIQYLNEYSNKI